MILSKIKNLYLRNEFIELLIHTNSIRNNLLHYLTLIKLTAARFVRTGGFLTWYSKDHTQKKTYYQLKMFRDYF
jgi:hypothetical protein